jgi:hypothetical protein
MSTDLTIHNGDRGEERPAWNPFQMMDQMDEEALHRELQGVASSELVYIIREGGQEVVGLSKQGIDEACMVLVGQGQVIREESLEYEILGEGEEREALFKVKAARFAVSPDGHEVRLDQVLGVKRQPLYFKPGRINTFWYEQGAMKAARNARFRLIPAQVRAQVIASARVAGAVRHAGEHQASRRVEASVTQDVRVERTESVSTQTNPYAPTEKQTRYYQNLVASSVFSEAEKEKMLDWLAEHGTRQLVKDQIDQIKRMIAEREAKA